jgi:hypothetical protein
MRKTLMNNSTDILKKSLHLRKVKGGNIGNKMTQQN